MMRGPIWACSLAVLAACASGTPATAPPEQTSTQTKTTESSKVETTSPDQTSSKAEPTVAAKPKKTARAKKPKSKRNRTRKRMKIEKSDAVAFLSARGGEETTVSSRRTLRAAAKPNCKEGVLPDFPWPIPKPSAKMALPKDLLAEAMGRDDRRLRHAAQALDALLRKAGYDERAYFRMRVDNETIGFALVTRMERIRSNGWPYPKESRFVPAGIEEKFSLVGFLKSLFVAPVGYYRILVFTVANRMVRADAPEVDSAVANEWLAAGDTRLRGCVADMPLTEDHGVDALVYEFRHAPEDRIARRANRRDASVFQLIPSNLTPKIHLERAGVLPTARN